MTIIRVPPLVEVSPESGGSLRLDTDTQTFSDLHGNVWPVSDLVASRPSNRLKAWLGENYSESNGGKN